MGCPGRAGEAQGAGQVMLRDQDPPEGFLCWAGLSPSLSRELLAFYWTSTRLDK